MTAIHSNGLRITRMCLALSLATTALTALGQVRITPPPNSGQLLQQVPQAPTVPPSSNLGLTIEPQNATPADNTTSFPVRSIVITGNTALPTATLHALVASSEGKTLTLNDLNALADRISDAYHQQGYPLATAYVPPQAIKDGVVRIDVAEARYGTVSLNNQSRVSTRVLDSTLAALQPGQPITEYPLERTLLLLSDIPGATASSTLKPGQQVGTSDLLVDIAPQQRYTGEVGVDDFGNKYTGRVRGNGSFNVNGLFDQGDALNVNAMTSGNGMTYGRLGYQYLLNGEGTTLGASISGLDYHLGDDLSALEAHGSAFVGSVVLAHPLIRNTRGNLFGQVEFDYRKLNDNIDIIGIQNDRQTSSWTATLAGDELDATGVINARASLTYGILAANNLQTDYIDQLGTDTAGHYVKLALSLSRLQQLARHDALYFGFSGQTASKNLDTSEQFYLGGPDSVRGYDVGVLAGAQGYLATLEYRHDAVFSRVPGVWQFSAFVDSGWVQQYKDPFVPGPNTGQLSSAGVGVQWSGPYRVMLSVSVAVPFGKRPELLGSNTSRSTHAWLQFRKGF